MNPRNAENTHDALSTADARILSVNIGSLRHIEFFGETVTTGIFKDPVDARVMARPLGLAGDIQADLTVHGGLDKAVYIYPQEHYASWEALLGKSLNAGSFGENITSAGLQEHEVFIGETFRFGQALLQAIQPRSPCYKLQIRFERHDMTALFARQKWPGWYASVLQEGTVGAGDQIIRVDRAQTEVSIADVWRYSFSEFADEETSRRVSALRWLPDFWKKRIAR